MNRNKISPSLQAQLNNNIDANKKLDIILELSLKLQQADHHLSRQEKIVELKDSFSRITEPVEQMIKKEGGQVVDRAWINQALRIVIPASALHALSQLEQVTFLDVPHILKLDE